MNNLQNTKQEILKKFEEKFIFTEYGGISDDSELKEEVKAFLAESLEEYREAVVEEVAKVIPRYTDREMLLMDSEHIGLAIQHNAKRAIILSQLTNSSEEEVK